MTVGHRTFNPSSRALPAVHVVSFAIAMDCFLLLLPIIFLHIFFLISKTAKYTESQGKPTFYNQLTLVNEFLTIFSSYKAYGNKINVRCLS